MGFNNYKHLLIWQKSMDLVEETYRLIKLLPQEETYALANQMRRAAVSIPSNIAEGQARKSKKDFIKFLLISVGSKSELETQLLICCRLNYLTESQIHKALMLCDEVSKMIYTLIDRLKAEL